MNDSSPDVARRFREMLLARSGEERLIMACSMHQAARQLVLAFLREQHPEATPDALRQGLFLRFYGKDFDLATTERILAALGEEGGPSSSSASGRRV